MRTFLASTFVALALSGCSGAESSGASDEFPSAPLEVVKSAKGLVTIQVRTSPTQPPTHGDFDAEVRLTDAQDKPLDAMQIDVQPWMPVHGHGATKPEVIAKGGGRFVLQRLQLVMPGAWELRTTITGAVDDSANIGLDVQ